MKLPTTQATQGTSMGSAMMNPAQVSQPRMRVAQSRPLVGTRNVAGEAALGAQKSQLALDIGKSAIDIGNAALRVVEADDTMASNAAIGEYNNRMAAWTTDSKISGNVLDEKTGLRRWETFDEDFDRESEALKNELRDKYKFKMKNSEINWNLKTAGIDGANKENIALYTNEKTAERAGASYQIAMAESVNFLEAQGLTADAVNSGIISEGVGITNMDNWSKGHAYDVTSKTLPSQNNAQLRKTQQDMLDNTGSIAKSMNEKGRGAIQGQAYEQVLDNNMSSLQVTYEADGMLAVTQRIDQLNRGGQEATGTITEKGHRAVIDKLLATRSDYAAIEKGLDVEQNGASFNNDFITMGASPEAAVAMKYRLFDSKDAKDNQRGLDSIASQLVGSEDRYRNNNLLGFSVNSARLDYLSPQVEYTIDKDIMGGDPEKIAGAMRLKGAIEANFPRAFEKMHKSVEDKALFYELYGEMNPPTPENIDKWTSDASKMFKENQNKPSRDVIRLDNTAVRELKDDPPLDRMKVFAAEHGDDSVSYWLDNINIEQEHSDYFEEDYRYARQYSSEAGASAFAWNRFRRHYAPTMMNSERTGLANTVPPKPTYKENKPESFPEYQGPTQADTMRHVRTEFESNVSDMNKVLDEQDLDQYNINELDTIRMPDGAWVVVDRNDFVITDKDGNHFEAEFDPYTDPQVEVDLQTNRVTSYDTARQQQADIIAQYITPVTTPPNTPALGVHAANISLEDATTDNYFVWDNMDGPQKYAASNAYKQRFNEIKQSNLQFGFQDGPDMNNSINLYLFGEGYLQAVTEGVESDADWEDMELKVPAGIK